MWNCAGIIKSHAYSLVVLSLYFPYTFFCCCFTTLIVLAHWQDLTCRLYFGCPVKSTPLCPVCSLTCIFPPPYCHTCHELCSLPLLWLSQTPTLSLLINAAHAQQFYFGQIIYYLLFSFAFSISVITLLLLFSSSPILDIRYFI